MVCVGLKSNSVPYMVHVAVNLLKVFEKIRCLYGKLYCPTLLRIPAKRLNPQHAAVSELPIQSAVRPHQPVEPRLFVDGSILLFIIAICTPNML